MSVSGSQCRGCKLGYDTRERDFSKAKCRIKLCCFRDKKLETCADCPDFSTCDIVKSFYYKNGVKYSKYRENIEFIMANGYEEFFRLADNWKGPYGRLV